MQASKWVGGLMAVVALCLWPGYAQAQNEGTSEKELTTPAPESWLLAGLRATRPEADGNQIRRSMFFAAPGVDAAAAREGSGRAAGSATAQGRSRGRTRDFFRGEAYFGVAYANLSLLGFASRRHAVGWGANVTGYMTKYFGITGDFSGQYDPECPQNDIECFVELLRATEIHDYNAHQFLVGPQVRTPGNRFQGFVHVLFGGVRTHASVLTLATGVKREITSGPNFAMAYGGGVDWSFADQFAIRMMQVDYIPVREGPGLWRHNIRIQGGVVFRFGG